MSDPAVVTSNREQRVCRSCGEIVEHRQNLHMSGATSWGPTEHRAGCGWLCLGGGIRGRENIALLNRDEVHRRNNCTRCKLPRPIFQGEICKCGNAARYITRDGEASCALCCVEVAALRVADVPEILMHLERMLDELDGYLAPELELDEERSRLRCLIGRMNP